jgi:hypothetical protein
MRDFNKEGPYTFDAKNAKTFDDRAANPLDDKPVDLLGNRKGAQIHSELFACAIVRTLVSG